MWRGLLYWAKRRQLGYLWLWVHWGLLLEAGLYSDPVGELKHSPEPLAAIRGPTSKERGREGEGKGAPTWLVCTTPLGRIAARACIKRERIEVVGAWTERRATLPQMERSVERKFCPPPPPRNIWALGHISHVDGDFTPTKCGNRRIRAGCLLCVRVCTCDGRHYARFFGARRQWFVLSFCRLLTGGHSGAAPDHFCACGGDDADNCAPRPRRRRQQSRVAQTFAKLHPRKKTLRIRICRRSPPAARSPRRRFVNLYPVTNRMTL